MARKAQILRLNNLHLPRCGDDSGWPVSGLERGLGFVPPGIKNARSEAALTVLSLSHLAGGLGARTGGAGRSRVGVWRIWGHPCRGMPA